MTTATGATAYDKKLGMPVGPPFALAIGGACIQLSTLAYTWSAHTSAGPCMAAPLHCLSNLGDADVWGRQVVLTGLMILVVWVVSVISGIREGKGWSDPSIVDRLWSIQPVLYLWHFALSAGSGSSPRGLLMAALVTAWGGRLTYNFTIKGGFSGAEDYRWSVVRGWWGAPSLKWEAFNLIFVVAFQQATILAFSAPPALALTESARPFGTLDVVAGVLVALLILGETVADRQMFVFQTEKYRRKNAGEKLGPEYERGFIETGLWGLTRHPNYFCEVSIWWAVYLFSVSATGNWLNWTILGPVFLTLLFVPPGASLDTTEAISVCKYPKYKEYQASVSRFFPWFPNKVYKKQ